jgi:signal transduction histidine kinase
MCENVPLAAPELIAASQPPAQPGQRQGRSHDQKRVKERGSVPLAPGAGLGEPAWEAFYGLVYVASTVLVESGSLSAAARVTASLALAAMIPWYLFLGRPVMRLDQETWDRTAASWRGPVYLTGLIAFFAVALHANPNAWFLAFAFSPQCFQVTTPMRRSMVFVVALNGVAALMWALGSRTAQGAATAAATALFSIGFSWVFSRWTARVVEQSHERAALLAQLEAAQAELAAANHEAGVLAERQRLAAEIHDTLAQGFLSIVTLIQAAQAAEGVRPVPAAQAAEGIRSARVAQGNGAVGRWTAAVTGPAREHLDLALATARENLAEARALVAALAPASLDDGGLAGAVARAAGATGRAAGIEASCAAEGTARPLPTTTEVVLLRVCQEALANVRRHAAASRVDVRLRYSATAVEVSVTDNGRGFAPAVAASVDTSSPLDTSTAAGTGTSTPAGASSLAGASRSAGASGPGGTPGSPDPGGLPGSGFGLRGMRERLRQAGGTLSVTTAPGAGTTVRAEIPA